MPVNDTSNITGTTLNATNARMTSAGAHQA